MKVKLGEIADSFIVLRELKETKLRVPIKYRLCKIFDICEAETRQYEQAVRELVLQHGGTAKGQLLTLPNENMEEIEPELMELRDTEIHIEHFQFLLDDFSSVEIVGDISKLAWLIKDNEDAANSAEGIPNQPSVN